MLIETQLPNLLHRGKVRDTYPLGDDRLLMVATDRISAFDVVLPTGIPDKGIVLNRMSAFWFDKTQHLIPNHFLCLADSTDAAGFSDDSGLLTAIPPEVASRAMIVHRAQRIDIECIVRGYITGSAWAEYRRQGTVSGQAMPAGLVEGDLFPEPLFTPTTKAEEGHDQNMTGEEVVDMVGAGLARQLEEVSKTVYQFALDFARERGVILADTKMEFGLIDGELTLIDELLTPDSSRFWDAAAYKPGQSQPSFDKQFVRDWLTEQGWDQSPPAPDLAPDIVAKTGQRYLEAYERLTGTTLD
ncbi:MAG: phosphoribosylaminoimidazolesuccinocarboxamide synthase [SAR202 cluster bacterium Io17-Chloro-G9]|nr:MAG: phosphoribosylaminoimidazolesuccinocarboxamide synthase [SAR202 cluster bacterium Io17-Chloro-G9]